MKAGSVIAVTVMSALILGAGAAKNRSEGKAERAGPLPFSGDRCLTIVNNCLFTTLNVAVAFPESMTRWRSRGWYTVLPKGGRKRLCWWYADKVAIHIDKDLDLEVPSNRGLSDVIPSNFDGPGQFCVHGSKMFDIGEVVGGHAFWDRARASKKQSKCRQLGEDYHMAQFYLIKDVDVFDIDCH